MRPEPITNATNLLIAIKFDGLTHLTMTSTQISQANSYATKLDLYNNNKLTCP